MELQITQEIRNTLFKYVRMAIADRLGISSGIDEAGLDFSDEIFKGKYGAFVTLHIGGKLRGCIGYIQGFKNLKETIHDLALSAAFSDPRFSPLTRDEFSRIDVEISILSPVEPVRDVEDIVPGRDGLIISRGFSSGLLLPQVATEQGWNRETFLSHTCMKAGLMPETWRENDVKIEKFTAVVFGEN